MQITDIGSNLYSQDVNQLSEKNLNNEDFLKLLVTYMKTQDPVSPIETKDLVSQVKEYEKAQNTAENGTDASNAANIAAASGLLGKELIYTDARTGTEMIGTARSLKTTGSEATLIIDGNPVPLSMVKSTFSPSASK